MTCAAKRNGSTKNQDRRSDQSKVPIVYFDLVTFPKLDLPPRIKIGESGNHSKRLKDHAKSKHGIDFKVDHLCVVRGDRADEQHILRYFSGHRLDNEDEVFWPNEELVEGRIAFWGGRATPSPDDGHAVFYFGSNVQEFQRRFSEIGNVWVK